MSNPFDLSEASNEDPIPLRNIATGVVMPNDAAAQLVDCFKTGTEEAKTFTRQRMDTSPTMLLCFATCTYSAQFSNVQHNNLHM